MVNNNKLSKLQRAVLSYVTGIEIPNREQIAKNLGISLATVRRAIARLKEQNVIVREGNNRTGKYILNKEKLREGK
jgi:DNA-binding GntR family transcriptional regulator